MNIAQAYIEHNQQLLNRAMQLAQHVGIVHPLQNIQPLLNLIRQADAFGLDLVPQNPALQQQRHLGTAIHQASLAPQNTGD